MRMKQFFSLAIVLLSLYVVTLEMSGVMPLVPVISSIYGIEASLVVYLNLGHAAFGVAAPFIGYQADRFGVKYMLVLIMLIFSCGAFLVSTKATIPVYVFGRALIGLSFFTMMGISQTYLASMVKSSLQPMISGIHRLIFASAILSSPLIGHWIISSYGFSMLYRLLSVMGIILVMLLLFVESPKVSHHAISLTSLKETMNGASAKKLLVATLLYGLPGILFFSYFSIYLAGGGYTASGIAQAYSMIGFGSLLAGVVILTLVKPIGFKRLFYAALLVAPIALTGLLFSKGIFVLLVGFMFGLSFDSGWGMMFPFATKIAPKHPSTYLTLVSLTMSLGSIASSLFAPTLYALGGFNLIMAVSIAGLLIALILIRPMIPKVSMN